MLAKPTGIILAAGGLLWKKASRGLEIQVIHRARYGDWCLPKGKIKEGETWEKAALREVWEETGCEAKITSFAGITQYKVNELPKVVFFWNMEAVGECSFKASEEVDQVLWMNPREAIKRLDYPEEKELLSSMIPSVLGRYWNSLYGYLYRSVYRRRYKRLSRAISAYRTELEYRSRKNKHYKKTDLCAEDASRKLLDCAQNALFDNDIEKGWKCFLASQRMEIFSLDEDDLKAQAVTLRHEAEKLGSWRKKALCELIGSPESPKNFTTEQAYRAALLLHEHYTNQAYKDGLVRTHLILLLIILATTVITVLYSANYGFFEFAREGEKSSLTGVEMMRLVALMGLFGGVFSAVLKVPDSSKSARIPELTSSIRLTLARVFMGTASAIFIYIFLNSKIAEKFFEGTFNFEWPFTTHTVFVIAFVAGFSERLVLRAVDFVAKEK